MSGKPFPKRENTYPDLKRLQRRPPPRLILTFYIGPAGWTYCLQPKRKRHQR